MSTSNIETGKFIAQGFSVPTPAGTTGVYVTKISLFFKNKTENSQIKLFITEVVNNAPDPTLVVPYSEVFLDSSQVNTSTDTLAVTDFVFSSPVFLSSAKKYAFCLQSSGSEYSFWGATRGEKDLVTNTNLDTNPLLENLYYREINGTYRVVDNEDMKFKIYRAKFTPGDVGVATLVPRENYDYIVFKSSEASKAKSILPTQFDRIQLQTATTWLDIGNYIAIHRIGDIDEEKYVVLFNNDSASLVAPDDVIRIVRKGFGSLVVDGNTTIAETEQVILEGVVDILSNYEYHTVLPRIDIESRSNASVKFSLLGAKANGSLFEADIEEQEISPDYEKNFLDAPRHLVSKSNLTGGLQPFKLISRLTTNTSWSAPLLRLDNSRALLVTNVLNGETDLINRYQLLGKITSSGTAITGTDTDFVRDFVLGDTINTPNGDRTVTAIASATSLTIDSALSSNIITPSEFGKNAGVDTETTLFGTGSAKYISRQTTLASGMDAEDVKVYVSAYKPINTNVVVYGRFQSSEDKRPFNEVEWKRLEQVTPPYIFSDSANTSDVIEYEYQLAKADKNVDGIYSYTVNGAQFDRYIRYSIKIVLVAEDGNEFNPPKVTDLKVIALQK